MEQQPFYQFKDEDIRLVDVIDSFGAYLKYLLRKWYIVILGVGSLTLGGYLFAILSPPTYIANASFNVVDPKGATGGLLSLASSLGFSLGGSSTNDVLLGIFSSRGVFKSAMLKDVVVNGKFQKLGDFYMSVFGYDVGIHAIPGYEHFKFTANSVDKMNRIEDSISSIMYYDYTDSYLTIEFDVPTGLIKAEIETPSYELSKLVGEAVMENTINYYQIKQVESAKISYDNVTTRLDSIKNQIELRDKLLATSQDVNVFNTKKEGVTDQDRLERDINNLTYMYADALNSQESAKQTMTGQNVTIRIVDDPSFSTDVSFRSKLIWTAIGFGAGIVLVIIPLILNKAVIDSRAEEAKKAAAAAA